MEIEQDVLEVLRASSRVDNRVYLPAGQLDRKLYECVNDVLTRLGGKWVGRKVKAHVFEDDDAAALLAEVLATGLMPPKNPLAFFETPEPVIQGMLRHVTVQPEEMIEPSAGNGAIVRGLQLRFPQAHLIAVEIDSKRIERLSAIERITVVRSDFLDFVSLTQYDLALMNPPFAVDGSPLEYLRHINHAYELLRVGGQLISIAPVGVYYRQDKRCAAMRDLMRANDAVVEHLPKDAFKESGTLISTIIISMIKKV